MWSLMDYTGNFGTVPLLRLLWGHVRKHPLAYSLLTIVAVSLGSGYVTVYLRYIHPARSTMAAFFEAIDDERYDVAWTLLDEDFQQRWEGGLEQFRRGYATTVKHTDISMSDSLSLRQLAGVIFNKCIELDVQYRVIDRFKRVTFEDPMQAHNRLSLELRHPARYRQLIAGSLPNSESTVELTRLYKKKATVSKKRGKWRISSLQSRFMTFDFQTR